MPDVGDWNRLLAQLWQIAQHTIVTLAVIASLWVTAHAVEWLLPPDAWFRKTLPFLEERAMMGVIVVLFVGLIVDLVGGWRTK